MTLIKNHAVHGDADHEAARRFSKHLERLWVIRNDSKHVNKVHDADPIPLEEERELRDAEFHGRSRSM